MAPQKVLVCGKLCLLIGTMNPTGETLFYLYVTMLSPNMTRILLPVTVIPWC